jgi:TRAP-type C4-dicarboxylate transport system substrate-binding protein
MTACPKLTPTEVINLKFHHQLPPGIDIAVVCDEWAKKVEEQTSGRVKVTIYPAEGLVKATDCYTSIVKGTCDIAFRALANDPSRVSLNRITDLPGMFWPSPEAASSIWVELMDEFPEMRTEFRDVKILWQYNCMPSVLNFTKKETRVPDDIKGMKLISLPPLSLAIDNMGASPIGLLPPEWYTSLERGLAEGVTSAYNVIYVHKIHPLVTYRTEDEVGLMPE